MQYREIPLGSAPTGPVLLAHLLTGAPAPAPAIVLWGGGAGSCSEALTLQFAARGLHTFVLEAPPEEALAPAAALAALEESGESWAVDLSRTALCGLEACIPPVLDTLGGEAAWAALLLKGDHFPARPAAAGTPPVFIWSDAEGEGAASAADLAGCLLRAGHAVALHIPGAADRGGPISRTGPAAGWTA